MTCQAVVLDKAQREIKDIVNYMADILIGPQAASNFLNEFDRQADLSRGDPEQFATSRLPELAAKSYHAARINNYIMLYAARNEHVYVAHFFHQAQDHARLIPWIRDHQDIIEGFSVVDPRLFDWLYECAGPSIDAYADDGSMGKDVVKELLQVCQDRMCPSFHKTTLLF